MERVQAEQEGQGRVADPHDPDDPLPAVGRGDVPPRELGQEPARTGEARPGQRGDVGRDDERHDEEPLQNPLPPDVGVGDEPCLDEPHGGREERRGPDDADGVEDARAHALGGRQVRVESQGRAAVAPHAQPEEAQEGKNEEKEEREREGNAPSAGKTPQRKASPALPQGVLGQGRPQ